MRNVLLKCVFVLFVFSTGVACAEDGFLTSERLTVSDVKGTVINHIKKTILKGATLKEIYGVFQDEGLKRAQVYFSVLIGGREDYTANTLLRFNSGKWFNTDVPEFVRR